MPTIWVKKASGETERFDSTKVIRSCLRSGLSRDQAQRILDEIKPSLYNGISTKEIYSLVREALSQLKNKAAMKYGLKKAIMRLGPTGFTFETYFSQILQNHGYTTTLREKRKGACITHEIDIIAEQDANGIPTRTLIECKYHNASGIFTGLKEALYTYARFLDLNEGHSLGLCEHYNDVWLVTNTKCSEDAQTYCYCKKIRLLGWNYPPMEGLEKMIESKGLYPVTILESISSRILSRFAQAELTLLKDLTSIHLKELQKRTRLSYNLLDKIKNEATLIV
ncbi:ATP cone domain-containing protein [[Eubacterium] cellulosolvens]